MSIFTTQETKKLLLQDTIILPDTRQLLLGQFDFLKLFLPARPSIENLDIPKSNRIILPWLDPVHRFGKNGWSYNINKSAISCMLQKNNPDNTRVTT